MKYKNYTEYKKEKPNATEKEYLLAALNQINKNDKILFIIIGDKTFREIKEIENESLKMFLAYTSKYLYFPAEVGGKLALFRNSISEIINQQRGR